MDKLIKFIDLYWPVEYCNFNCEYCYVHQHRENKGNRYVCSHTPEEIRKALSRKRLGGTCLINICAGGRRALHRSSHKWNSEKNDLSIIGFSSSIEKAIVFKNIFSLW